MKPFKRRQSGDKLHLFVSFLISAALIAFSFSCSHIRPYRKDSSAAPRVPAYQAEDLELRLILIGDAGATGKDEPVLDTLEGWAGVYPRRTMTFFLGDNVYPKGIPESLDPRRMEAERRLKAQIEAVQGSGCRGYFIPGNHDWNHGLPGLLRQAELVRDGLGREDAFLPEPGCPGPVHIDTDRVRIIIMDNTFWLNEALIPGDSCPSSDKDEFFRAVGSLIEGSQDRHVVMLSHLPWLSHGEHGGYYTWKDHLFPLTHLVDWLYIPLPIVGSLYPLSRRHIVKSPHDIFSALYRDMVRRFRELGEIKAPLVNAGGHEHNLQVLDGRSLNVGYVLVAGAGSQAKLSPVGHSSETLFAHEHTGFMVLDFLKNGRVWLQVVEPGSSEAVFIKKLSD